MTDILHEEIWSNHVQEWGGGGGGGATVDVLASLLLVAVTTYMYYTKFQGNEISHFVD